MENPVPSEIQPCVLCVFQQNAHVSNYVVAFITRSRNGFIRKRRPDMFETRLWKKKKIKNNAINTEESTLTCNCGPQRYCWLNCLTHEEQMKKNRWHMLQTNEQNLLGIENAPYCRHPKKAVFFFIHFLVYKGIYKKNNIIELLHG